MKKQKTPAASPKKKTSATSAVSSKKFPTLPTGPTPRQAKRLQKETRFNARYQTHLHSPEEILELQIKNWTNKYYAHFNMPPAISIKTALNGSEQVIYVFYCARFPSVFVQRDRIQNSMSQLRRHAVRCQHKANPTALDVFARGSTYNFGRLRFLVAKWVVRRYRPFAIIEDEELREILQMMDCRVHLYSQKTVARDVIEMFESCQFENYTGVVHIGLDGWTSPNLYSFLGVTVHYLHQGTMKTAILDFVKLTRAHTGPYLAEQLHQCLQKYNLDTKLMGIVCDNASNNDTMVDSLDTLIPTWGGSPMRVRCFAHVLNLVVRAILSVFTIKKKKNSAGDWEYVDPKLTLALDEIDTEDNEDYDIESYEDDGQAEADEAVIEAIDDTEDSITDVCQAHFPIEKLKGLAKTIFHSPAIRDSLQQECVGTNPPTTYQVLVRPVVTRWNSLTMTIKGALIMRPALTALFDHDRTKGSRLRRVALDEEDWQILEELFPLLDHFLVVTKKISRSAFPLIHMVIPYIDQLTESLHQWSTNQKLHTSVRIASQRGLTIMNKYYSLTDNSVVYRIAMLMHPKRKQAYFRAAKWPEQWIQTAIQLARDVWVEKYKPNDDQELTCSPGTQMSHFTDVEMDGPQIADAFEVYISSPPIANVSCPIAYWYALEQSGDPLASMALRFLTCPATSVDVERAFSRGQLTVSRSRHSLSDESTRSLTVLNSWFQHEHFIPCKTLIRSFDKKQKRPNNGKAAEEVDNEGDYNISGDESSNEETVGSDE